MASHARLGMTSCYSLQLEGRDWEFQARHPDVHAQNGGSLHLVNAVWGLQLEDVLHEVVLPLHLLEDPTDVAQTNHPFRSAFVRVSL